MSKIKITRIVQTSTACPSQWDMWDEDGVYYYVRYRYGDFTVDQEKIGNEIFYKQIGDALDGWMEKETMFQVLSDLFDFSETEEVTLKW